MSKKKQKNIGEMKAIISETPTRAFTPQITENVDANKNMLLAWNFHRMDSGGKFKCTLKDLDKHSKQLIKWEKKTIKEVFSSNNHNHPLGKNKISKTASERANILQLEVETLFQLDLGTPVRLWGILERNIFHILWLDEKHEVYKSK